MRINRYIVATSGVVFHLMLGSVYAWSVYTQAIATQTSWSEASITFAFSIAIFFLGMSAAFMGRLVEKFGPRLTGTISSFCYGAGTVLTGLAIHSDHLWMLYIAYGVIGGIGLGSGYVTPVSTIIKWFPKHRGMATGCAIMGFGFASMITGPIAQSLIVKVGVEATFYILGAIYFIVMISAAQFIRPPKPGEIIDEQSETQITGVSLMNGQQLTANQAVRTREFKLLWLMLFINISCGIGLVSAASPMAQHFTNMSVAKAALMVGIVGVFNGLGRLAWASISDYIGRPNTFTIVFGFEAILLFTLMSLHSSYLFTIALCIIISGYGAGFSVIPAYLSDIFGTKDLGAIHGYVLTAWGIAGLVGPLLLSFSHEISHSYNSTLIVFGTLEILALTVSFFIRKRFTKSVGSVADISD
ncbi:OFA family MFS transporter [Paucilactobacillus suebicus]|nr:OFA family MFS transporter [Paucilactobacillus suebicus]